MNFCPICKWEDPEYFIVVEDEIVGCSCCVKQVTPDEWNADHPQFEPYAVYEPEGNR